MPRKEAEGLPEGVRRGNRMRPLNGPSSNAPGTLEKPSEKQPSFWIGVRRANRLSNSGRMPIFGP